MKRIGNDVATRDINDKLLQGSVDELDVAGSFSCDIEGLATLVPETTLCDSLTEVTDAIQSEIAVTDGWAHCVHVVNWRFLWASRVDHWHASASSLTVEVIVVDASKAVGVISA